MQIKPSHVSFGQIIIKGLSSGRSDYLNGIVFGEVRSSLRDAYCLYKIIVDLTFVSS